MVSGAHLWISESQNLPSFIFVVVLCCFYLVYVNQKWKTELINHIPCCYEIKYVQCLPITHDYYYVGRTARYLGMNYTAYSTSDAHYLCEKREKWNNAITITGELGRHSTEKHGYEFIPFLFHENLKHWNNLNVLLFELLRTFLIGE